MSSVIRLAPFSYAHIADSNTNTTRLVVGPKSVTLQDHEQLVYGPADCVKVGVVGVVGVGLVGVGVLVGVLVCVLVGCWLPHGHTSSRTSPSSHLSFFLFFPRLRRFRRPTTA